MMKTQAIEAVKQWRCELIRHLLMQSYRLQRQTVLISTPVNLFSRSHRFVPPKPFQFFRRNQPLPFQLSQ
jgi:hypothetical protein